MTAALVALALAFSPLEAEERNVREGNEALLAGDPAAALRGYDAAERAVGPRAEIDYDRGIALHRLGRHAEARDAYRRAVDRGAGTLSSRTLQNLGTALDALGDPQAAVGAFREALRRDPGNEDARFDLEVLLRRRPGGGATGKEPRPGGRGAAPGERRDGKGPDDAQDGAGSSPPPAGGERRAPAAPQPGAEGTPRPPDGSPRDGPEREGPPEARDARGGAREAPLSRQDAEQLLDAFRARERNLPLAGREPGKGRRSDAAKDW